MCMCTFNIEHDAISYITSVCEATLVPNRKNLQQILLDLLMSASFTKLSGVAH